MQSCVHSYVQIKSLPSIVPASRLFSIPARVCDGSCECWKFDQKSSWRFLRTDVQMHASINLTSARFRYLENSKSEPLSGISQNVMMITTNYLTKCTTTSTRMRYNANVDLVKQLVTSTGSSTMYMRSLLGKMSIDRNEIPFKKQRIFMQYPKLTTSPSRPGS